MLLCYIKRGSNLLADTGVARKNVCILCDGQFGWIGVADFKHTAPLRKVGSILFILGTAIR